MISSSGPLEVPMLAGRGKEMLTVPTVMDTVAVLLVSVPSSIVKSKESEKGPEASGS